MNIPDNLRVPIRDYLERQRRIARLKADWLWQFASAQGRQRLLQEHGLLRA